jgi:hypothetical protein
MDNLQVQSGASQSGSDFQAGPLMVLFGHPGAKAGIPEVMPTVLLQWPAVHGQ